MNEEKIEWLLSCAKEFMEDTSSSADNRLGNAIHLLYFEMEAIKKERKDTIRILRQVCAEFGSTDWSDNLYLADIVEKHLWKQLEAARINITA